MNTGKCFVGFIVLALLSGLEGCEQSPDLVASGMDVTWADTTHQVRAYVTNMSSSSAGSFLVYFDADEDPESTMDRPQVRLSVPELAGWATVTLDADFSPLASAHNAQLGNVKKITLRVNPKRQIAETNEQNNIL